MRIPRLYILGLLSLGLALAGVLAVQLVFAPEDKSEITETQARAALRWLRQSLGEGPSTKIASELAPVAGDALPMVLTVWSSKGREHVLQVDGAPLGQALDRLARELGSLGLDLNDPRLRLQLDLAVSEGWVPEGGILAALAFVEGRDGVSGLVNAERVYLPPTELIRQGKYGGFKPLPDLDSRFSIGLDLKRVENTLRHQARRLGIHGDKVKDLRRFRSLTVVEGQDLKPRRLFKSTVRRPPMTRARARAAVMAGARYLTRALKDDGTYRYYYNPLWNKDEAGDYNWPRHAGVTYSLALVGRLLKRPEFLGTAKKALAELVDRLANGPEDTLCLMHRKKCYLGSSALGLLALSEYRIASGDTSFGTHANRLARFLLYMQKQDGFFFHDWYPDRGIDEELMKLYASQQAVFALARHSAATGDQACLEAAVKGMNYLSGPYWDHFLGTFFFGQEHWTCLAAEELYAARPRDAYAKLCHGIGVHYDNVTHNRGETPFEEDTGGMSITHMFTPHLGGTATAAEAMVSAVILGEATGRSTTSIGKQLADTFGFLVQNQVTAHDTFWIGRPDLAIGGFYETQSAPKIRIDNVQHAISAMVRGLHMLPDTPNDSLEEPARDYAL